MISWNHRLYAVSVVRLPFFCFKFTTYLRSSKQTTYVWIGAMNKRHLIEVKNSTNDIEKCKMAYNDCEMKKRPANITRHREN